MCKEYQDTPVDPPGLSPCEIHGALPLRPSMATTSAASKEGVGGGEGRGGVGKWGLPPDHRHHLSILSPPRAQLVSEEELSAWVRGLGLGQSTAHLPTWNWDLTSSA